MRCVADTGEALNVGELSELARMAVDRAISAICV